MDNNNTILLSKIRDAIGSLMSDMTDKLTTIKNNLNDMIVVKTASGSIATFETDIEKPLISCNIEILPKQAAGTPSPSNPLPISGTDTIIVTQTDSDNVTISQQTVSLPSTVYGGEVDVIGGSGESNYILTTIGNSGWNLYNNQYFYKTFDDKITPSIGDTSNPVFCSVLPYGGSKYGSSFEDGYIYQSSTKNLYIKDSSCADMTAFYDKYSNAQISYKLATPTQITLANPIDLTAKSGVNNVFGDTDGNTTVQYLKKYKEV